MHELSIALSIIEVASEEAQRLDLPAIEAIHLKLGPLSGVVPEALRSAYDLAREHSPLAEARLVIEAVPVLLDCPTCRGRRPPVSLQQLCCSQCGSVGSVVAGRELEITALEVADDHDHAPCASAPAGAQT